MPKKTGFKIVENAATGVVDPLKRKVFEFFKTFIAMPEFGNALRRFITPTKIPGVVQSLVINPQIINISDVDEEWVGGPTSSSWVVTKEAKLPVGLHVDKPKIITFAPFALPTVLPKRLVWMVEIMPINMEGEEIDLDPSVALRLRYRCGHDTWTELVSEPIHLVAGEATRFGFDVPLSTVAMTSLFESLIGVTPMGTTPVIVRAVWMSVAAFE